MSSSKRLFGVHVPGSGYVHTTHRRVSINGAPLWPHTYTSKRTDAKPMYYTTAAALAKRCGGHICTVIDPIPMSPCTT